MEQNAVGISSDVIRGYNDTMILYILRDEPSYGYEISKRIRAKTDGKYVIKATLNGKELPPRVLKENLADLYVSYEKDGLKELVLKQLLMYVYTWKKERKKRK